MSTIETKAKITPNPEQQQCIDNIDGKYLVLAGPGTGKTFTVVQRIKAMLEKGINPEKILCLSFSDSAAGEMRKKLEETFDAVKVNINIYTYHGFCNKIISENLEEFELPENYKVIGDTVKRQFLKEAIDEFEPVYLRNDKNDPYVYFSQTFEKFEEIKKRRMTKKEYFNNLKTNPDYIPAREENKNKIETLKRENSETNAKKIETLLKKLTDAEKKVNKAEEVWALYEIFKAKMEKEYYIDYDDMITLVLEKFEKSPAFLEEIANNYEYIMVDEYQDTNNLQNQIIFNLVSALKTQNIFVVGDDEQIIYSFQGANIHTIEGFLHQFPEDIKVVCLKDNMRSTQTILDAARIVAEQDPNRLENNKEFNTTYNITKKLTAKNENIITNDRKIRITKYNDEVQECEGITEEIFELINSDECPKDKNGDKKLSEIAVLATSNADLTNLSKYFKTKNIPFELKDGKSIYEIKASITLFYYLQMLTNPELYCDKVLKLLLLPPYNINPIDFAKIYERMSKDITYIESMRIIEKWQEPEKIQNFLDTYDYLREFNSAENLKDTVLEVLNRTGILKYYLNQEINRIENISGLKKIIDEATDFSDTHKQINLEAFVDYLTLIYNDDALDIRTDKPPVTQNAIQLSTYHSSKGKEYEYVYMPFLKNTKWESSRQSFKPQIPVSPEEQKDENYWKEYKISDRVKTMFVGMTRAKHTLRLSYNATANPSKWILKIANSPYNLTEDVVKEVYTNESHNELIQNIITKNEYDYQRDFQLRLNSILKDKQYSPTDVNVYINCPKQYLYGSILNLDSRVNTTDSLNALNYGNAVHNTLEKIVELAIKDKEYPSKEFLLTTFEQKLQELPFTTREQRKILHDRGVNELSQYYHHIVETPISDLFATEYKIELEYDDVNFKGRVDKIEKNPDETYTIYDYKTGKVKTEEEICPGGAHEDYYNQICLYKYYFEKANNVKVSSVAFIFPISVDSPVLRLYPTDKECLEVVEKFKNAINGIKHAEFKETPSKKACQYCQYKDFCMMNAV